MRYIDIPPMWLALCVAISWWIGQVHPLGLELNAPFLGLPGGLLVGAGLLLMLLAVIEMRKWRTTIFPGHTPSHLVQSGIFRRSRNPIYLGDVMVLAGLILYWDAPLALPLVPGLMWLLEHRFIRPEEKRMRQAFKADFFRYTQKTRRWV